MYDYKTKKGNKDFMLVCIKSYIYKLLQKMCSCFYLVHNLMKYCVGGKFS